MRGHLSIPALLLALQLSASASASASTSASVSAPFCAFADIFGAGAPPYYVTYKTAAPPTIDGSLDDPAWLEVPWTQSNPDICGYADPTDGPCSTAGNCAKGCAAPRFRTRQKLRYDDRFLYVAAELTETQVWANNTAMQSVIFSDNDYEVFISPDGSNHNYKEFEINARNVSWSLSLDKPYSDGGYENSSRVFGNKGWTDPGVRTATKVHGCEVNVVGPCRSWTVELAFPLATIAYNNTNTGNSNGDGTGYGSTGTGTYPLPLKQGQYWRINFSRVEWKVHVVAGTGAGVSAGGGEAEVEMDPPATRLEGRTLESRMYREGDSSGNDDNNNDNHSSSSSSSGSSYGEPAHYVLGARAGDGSCTWPCPGGCKQNPGDNWLWAPLGVVDVHQPERWGYLQVGATTTYHSHSVSRITCVHTEK